jgi:DNA repair exonuclease SbcCD ATPase subunit
MANSHARLQFPRIHGLSLRSFSVFSRKPNLSVQFSDGVSCLAGANGLGKSTFIAALNFGLTGIVSEPSRRFTSADEYYRFSKAFSQDFFSGRIVERDRKAAEVAVDFTLGTLKYQVVRGVFEPDQLRKLTITGQASDDTKQEINGSNLSGKNRLERYEARLAADIGLESFEQFVFLQNYILTFDERRHLLFWDETVLEQALYIAFGVSPQEAQKADVLRRDSEKAGSLARNANWQATELRNKIEELEGAIALSRHISENSSIELEAHYKALISQQEEVAEKQQRLDGILSDITVRIALIEIKWLGKSRNNAKITSEYTQARALSGASQLADYLDMNKVQAPTHKTRGYLVIIDGRRAKLKKQTDRVNVLDGMKYAGIEISYNPRYHDHRTDFELPVRMFAEPICRP